VNVLGGTHVLAPMLRTGRVQGTWDISSAAHFHPPPTTTTNIFQLFSLGLMGIYVLLVDFLIIKLMSFYFF
jgi:hypothetical protein